MGVFRSLVMVFKKSSRVFFWRSESMRVLGFRFSMEPFVMRVSRFMSFRMFQTFLRVPRFELMLIFWFFWF